MSEKNVQDSIEKGGLDKDSDEEEFGVRIKFDIRGNVRHEFDNDDYKLENDSNGKIIGFLFILGLLVCIVFPVHPALIFFSTLAVIMIADKIGNIKHHHDNDIEPTPENYILAKTVFSLMFFSTLLFSLYPPSYEICGRVLEWITWFIKGFDH